MKQLVKVRANNLIGLVATLKKSKSYVFMIFFGQKSHIFFQDQRAFEGILSAN